MLQIRSVTVLCMLLLIGSGATAFSQNPDLRPGDPAPELGLTKLLQASPGAKADRNSLNGKVVVLEFWATWCAPCIAAMPHLNELAEKFKDKPVQFIAVTDERESIVAPFLKRRTLNTWVGLDTERSTMKSYSVKFFPTTIVVGTDGRIAAITQPKTLTEKMLSDILEGKSTEVAAKLTQPPQTPVQKPAPQDEVKPLFALTIKPTRSTGTNWRINPGIIKGRLTLKNALSLVHDISETRILGPTLPVDAYYEISATMEGGKKDDLKLILARAIEASFKLKVHRETREVDVFVLTAPNPADIKLRPNTAEVGHWSDDEGVMAASAAPFRALTDGLEGVLKQPVVDETNLTGKYDWDLLFNAKDQDSIIEAVTKDLGLDLKRGKRRIEVLVVEVE